MKEDNGVSFAALIHPSPPTSGPSGGMSFVLFPLEGRCLAGLIIDTLGLSPDKDVLGRPGNARKAAAIARWLNRKHGPDHKGLCTAAAPGLVESPLGTCYVVCCSL